MEPAVTFMGEERVSPIALQADQLTVLKDPNEVPRYQDPLLKIREALTAPFDVEQIKWLPNPKTKQLFAYAATWDYKRRLDEVAYGMWSETQPTVVTSGTKVFVSVAVILFGRPYGGLGEEELSNQNAGTVAYSQAFRRACANFGLGRYMYDFGRIWADEGMFAQLQKENYQNANDLGLELAVEAYKKAGIPMDERYYSLKQLTQTKQASAPPKVVQPVTSPKQASGDERVGNFSSKQAWSLINRRGFTQEDLLSPLVQNNARRVTDMAMGNGMSRDEILADLEDSF